MPRWPEEYFELKGIKQIQESSVLLSHLLKFTLEGELVPGRKLLIRNTFLPKKLFHITGNLCFPNIFSAFLWTLEITWYPQTLLFFNVLLAALWILIFYGAHVYKKTCLFCVCDLYTLFYFFYFFISWRLITLQYCSVFCHTLTWIRNGFTCIPHPDPPSHLPLHPIPLGLPSAPGLSTCLMHPTWAGDLFHPR